VGTYLAPGTIFFNIQKGKKCPNGLIILYLANRFKRSQMATMLNATDTFNKKFQADTLFVEKVYLFSFFAILN